MESFGGGENFLDNFGVILLVDFLLDAEGVHVRSGKEIVTVRAKAFGEKTAVIGVRATKLKHKFIIAQVWAWRKGYELRLISLPVCRDHPDATLAESRNRLTTSSV